MYPRKLLKWIVLSVIALDQIAVGKAQSKICSLILFWTNSIKRLILENPRIWQFQALKLRGQCSQKWIQSSSKITSPLNTFVEGIYTLMLWTSVGIIAQLDGCLKQSRGMTLRRFLGVILSILKMGLFQKLETILLRVVHFIRQVCVRPVSNHYLQTSDNLWTWTCPQILFSIPTQLKKWQIIAQFLTLKSTSKFLTAYRI